MSRPGNPFTLRAHVLDLLVFAIFLLSFAVLLAIVPVVTRSLILLQPRLPNIQVKSSSLSILNVSSSSITTKLNVMFSIENPNSRAMLFYGFESLARNGTIILGHNLITSRFEQAGKTKSRKEAVLNGMSFGIHNCTTDNNTLDLACAAFNLSVEARLRAKYRGWTWPIATDSIRVLCENVKVEFPSDTTKLELGPSKCNVSGRWGSLVTQCTEIFWKYLYAVGIFIGILALSL